MTGKSVLRLVHISAWVALLLLGLILAIGGCQKPEPAARIRDTVALPVTNTLPVAVRVVLVRVSSTFDGPRVTRKLQRTQDILNSFGVGFDVVALHEVEAEQWLTVDEGDWASLDQFVKNTNEHLVVLTDKVLYTGTPVSGLGNGRWCVIARNSWDITVAHEILHGALQWAKIDVGTQGHRDKPLNLMESTKITEDHVQLDWDQRNALTGWAKHRWGKTSP